MRLSICLFSAVISAFFIYLYHTSAAALTEVLISPFSAWQLVTMKMEFLKLRTEPLLGQRNSNPLKITN